MNWKEHRDYFALGAAVAFALAVIFLIIRLAGGPSVWAAGRIGVLLILMGWMMLGCSWACEYLTRRKPMVKAYPWRYRRLKQKTVKKLRQLKADGKLTQNEIQKQKGAYLVIARKCGIDQEQARDDFELQIRKRVMNHDDT